MDLAPRMRAADVAEVRALGYTPMQALTSSVMNTKMPVAIMQDGRPIALFGAGETLEPLAGNVWLLGSEELTQGRNLMRFIRECRPWIDALHEQYPLLGNVVDERNTVHIRWLQWCGFTFINRHESYGAEGRPFLEFLRHRKVSTEW